MGGMFSGKVVLVTGGTGSIGSEIVRRALAGGARKVIALSRDEIVHFMMRKRIADERFETIIGDVRSIRSIEPVFSRYEIDLIYHAAAMKHVVICEEFPMEAVQTNILGTQNVVDLAVQYGVPKMVTISTDKAVHPVNVMGATKFIASSITINANGRAKGNQAFSCVRLGNVANSRGSVIPVYIDNLLTGKPLELTDREVTRFLMRISDAAELIIKASQYARGGETFVLKMKAFKLGDLVDVMVNTVAPRLNVEKDDIRIKVTGLIPGEKLHEELIDGTECSRIYELDEMYVILPGDKGDVRYSPNMRKVSLSGCDSSQVGLLTRDELERIVRDCLDNREAEFETVREAPGSGRMISQTGMPPIASDYSPATVKRIALVGICSGRNIGDAAIHLGAARLLRAVFPNASISHHTLYSARGAGFSSEQLWIEEGSHYFPALLPTLQLTPTQQRIPRLEIIGYLARDLLLLLLCRLLPQRASAILSRQSEREALKDLAAADLVVGAPGFRFRDTAGGVRGLISCLIDLYPLILSGVYHRRRVILGISLGQLRGRLSRWLVRRILNTVERVFVRESETVNYLVKDSGVNPQVVELIPDLAFLFRNHRDSTANHYIPAANGHNKIAIAIWAPLQREQRDSYYQVISNLIDRLIQSKDAYVFMVPHTKDTGDQVDDTMEIPKIISMIKQKNRVSVLPFESPPYGITDFYSKMDLVVTSRLHAIVLSRPVPVVAIPTMVKHRLMGTMSCLGLSDYYIDSLSVEEVEGVIDQAWNQRAQIRTQQEEMLQQIAGELESLKKEIKLVTFR